MSFLCWPCGEWWHFFTSWGASAGTVQVYASQGTDCRSWTSIWNFTLGVCMAHEETGGTDPLRQLRVNHSWIVRCDSGSGNNMIDIRRCSQPGCDCPSPVGALAIPPLDPNTGSCLSAANSWGFTSDCTTSTTTTAGQQKLVQSLTTCAEALSQREPRSVECKAALRLLPS